MKTEPSGNSGELASGWLTCSAASCSRHKDCMYTPCRNTRPTPAPVGAQAVGDKDARADAMCRALQEAWDDWLSDTGCFPDCITITRGPKLAANFSISNFARHVAMEFTDPQLAAANAQIAQQAAEIAWLKRAANAYSKSWDKVVTEKTEQATLIATLERALGEGIAIVDASEAKDVNGLRNTLCNVLAEIEKWRTR